MATKRIKFIKPWMMVPAGAEREFNTPIADELIRIGRAEEVKQAPMTLSKKQQKQLKRAMRSESK